MRIAIIGSGAVGGLYGGLLAKSGQDVHFLLHSDFDHVKQHGLRVDSVAGDFHLTHPVIYRRASDMPVCDVVIVAIKSTLNASLDQWLPPILSDQSIVLTLQNGLDVEADVGRSLDTTRVLGGCCFLCSNKIGPGHIKHLDFGRIVFGTYVQDPLPHTVDTGHQLRQAMIEAGIDAQWTDNLAAARWRKLMWNIPFNGLSVVMDSSTDKIIGDADGKALAEAIVKEVHDGAAACGVSLPHESKDTTIKHTEQMVPYDSSMRLDDRNGREMEVEAIFGNPLRAVAAVADVNQLMPKTQMLYQLLAHRNRNRLNS
ncbi:MAG: putative 2-dehydropantoate 2-reductase [Planctomycetota bacterium]